MIEECKPKIFGLIDGHKWKKLGETRYFSYWTCERCGLTMRYLRYDETHSTDSVYSLEKALAEIQAFKEEQEAQRQKLELLRKQNLDYLEEMKT